MIKVFISYSPVDCDWVQNWLIPKLENAGIQSVDDSTGFTVGNPILKNIEHAINTCDKTLLVLTPNWLKNEWAEATGLMLQTKNPTGSQGGIIPLMLEPCTLPSYLKMFTPVDFTRKEMWQQKLDQLLRQWGITVPGTPPSTAIRVFTSKLPNTSADLFGRENELSQLDDAWQDKGIHVVSLVALGGIGKSSLVNYWLNRMEQDNYRGAKRVYGWSFYNQGATAGTQTSADVFLQDTLKWFGDTNPTEGDPVAKGQRLADLIRTEPTLLILDGLEPLQYSHHESYGAVGEIKDHGVRRLLKELGTTQPGLCVITSREKVTDLKSKMGFSLREISLEKLSEQAGVKLLKKLGVKGPDKEIAMAVQEYRGHALALRLLGNYLVSVYCGDIRKRDLIEDLGEEEEEGRHARHVMQSYATWLGKSPEHDILSILGLFDRPAPQAAIETLKREPIIEGVTNTLVALPYRKWQAALKRMRDLGLIANENKELSDTLDCHPLVREYFGQQLATRQPKGWQEAHVRLYDYYRNLPQKDLPETLEEMEPLFAAITHGCCAGKHQEALLEVYNKRIKRGGATNYCCTQLGAFGADLAALSHFFTTPWSQPAAGLTDSAKAWVVNCAAFRLRALGRLLEAQDPMLAGLRMDVQREDWRNAAQAAGNLSELNLTLGQVPAAVEYGRQAVEYADRSQDEFMKEAMRTTHADALWQAGDRVPAEKLFLEAENLQKKRQPESFYLYALQGYQFCDLLLAQGKHLEVKKRAEHGIIIAQRNNWLLPIALDHLSLGRAGLLAAQENKKKETWSQALAELNQGVEGLRKAGAQEFLVKGLLARALYYRLTQQYQKAWTDLTEALEIAELGSMKLFIADYHLEACQLELAQGNRDAAATHLAEAERRVIEMGYGRRKEEIAQLKNELRIENG